MAEFETTIPMDATGDKMLVVTNRTPINLDLNATFSQIAKETNIPEMSSLRVLPGQKFLRCLSTRNYPTVTPLLMSLWRHRMFYPLAVMSAQMCL